MYLDKLHEYFGFDQFRLGQQPVIEHLVAGHSVAAIFPTGSGKSLCYQLPAILLPHLTLVVSPLLALMKDQLDFLAAKNIPAASIDSIQTKEQAKAVMQQVRQGQIKILMISVERFKNERFREFIRHIPISLLVIDEAHCISEWGHNFRPDYLQLPLYAQQFNIPQTLLLTATATPKVIADMQAKFNIAPEHVVSTGFYRANLYLAVEPVADNNKLQALLYWLNQAPALSSIVYVTLQHTAEDIASTLNHNGINAKAYHAGMEHDLRQQIQQRFMSGEIHCIVATIAFGMGIDKSDIRQVIHYDLPKSIENYSQEIGRAGRDGAFSQCVVLANADNLNVLENFVYGDTPELSGITTVLQQIKAHSDPTSSQWETLTVPLSNLSNIRQLPLKTLLVYLQLEGILQPLYAYFADYQFKLLIDQQQLYALFSGERGNFVHALVSSAHKGRTWYTVDFDALYQSYGAERSRAIVALEYFQDKGYIELQSKQMTDVYRVLRQDYVLDELAVRLYQQFKDKESSEINRIHQMLAFFQSDSCLSQRLSRYFGDQQLTQPCGHCSVCNGYVATLPMASKLSDITQFDFHQLCGAFIAACPTPPSTQLLARFLCGLSVPIFTKVKAKKMSGFGKLEAYRYADVVAFCAAHRP